MRAGVPVAVVALLLGGGAAWRAGSRPLRTPAALDSLREDVGGPPAEPTLRGRPGVTRGERRREPEPDPPAAIAPAGDAPGPGTSPDGAPGSRRAAGIEVLVVDAAGSPVPDAVVEVPRHRTTTDREGRATLPPWGFDMGSPSADRYWKTVRVHAPGFVPVAHRGGRSREVIRLEARGGRVRGHCTDEGGAALAGVTLRLAWRQGFTDLELVSVTEPDGTFTFTDAPWAPARVEVAGRTWVARPVCVVPPQEDVRVVLVPATAAAEDAAPAPPAEGPPTVKDPDAPWVGVDASDIAGLHLRVTAVLEDGTVRGLDWIEAGTTLQLPLPTDGLAGLLLRDAYTEVAWRQPAASRTVVRLRRPSAGSVRFRLLDAAGRGIEEGSASVRWADVPRIATTGRRDADLPPDAHGPATTGAGEFDIPNVPSGVYDLVWQSGSHGRLVLLRRGLVMPDPPQALEVGDVPVPSPVELVVRVADRIGPVPGAVVRLGAFPDDVYARTDRDGICRLSVPDPANVVIEASHDARGRGTVRVGSVAPGAEVLVVVEPASEGARPGG